MARDLFIDLTNRRLAVSETNSAPAGQINFTKGDNGAFNLYFLEATGIINRPYEVVSQAGTVKFGIGSRTGVPETGTYTLTFGGDTTSGIDAAATAGAIQTALNALSAISSAGGVTVTGELSDHFTVRFNSAGTQGSITADVSQLIPDTVAVIDERVAGSASVKEIQEIQLRLTPAVYQDSWTNLSTMVTATIATTISGSNTTSWTQRLSFSQKPFGGTYRLRLPAADYFLETGSISNGVFTDEQFNHGFSLNQPIQFGDIVISGGAITSGTTYYIRTIPAPNQFTVALTAGGTVITNAGSLESGGGILTFARETAPISAQASAADVQAALEALDSIGTGGVVVSGIQGEYYDITFSGTKAFSGYIDGTDYYTSLTGFEITNSTTAKPGKTADVNFATFALRDLVGNNPSVDLDLEIEITESGARSTVVLGGCTVSEELIDADSFSPVVGYPSYIFSVMTANQAVTNSTTLVDANGLAFTAATNSAYFVSYSLLGEASGDATSVMKGKFSAPTGSEFFGIPTLINDGTSSATFPNSDNGSYTAFDSEYFVFAGEGGPGIYSQNQNQFYMTVATGGEVKFQFAQGSAISGESVTLRKGSYLRAEKVS